MIRKNADVLMSPARKRMAALEKNKFVFVNLTKVRWIHRACTKWNTKVKKILLNLHWRNIAARNYARANRSKFAPLPRFIFHDALTLVNRSTSFVLFSFVYSLVLQLPEKLNAENRFSIGLHKRAHWHGEPNPSTAYRDSIHRLFAVNFNIKSLKS